jgi:hypothetical protein
MSTTTAIITVLKMRPADGGRVLAFVDVEVLLDGVPIRVINCQIRGDGSHSSVHLPTTRLPSGEWVAAIGLPDEIREGIADVVQEHAIEVGILRRVEPAVAAS